MSENHYTPNDPRDKDKNTRRFSRETENLWLVGFPSLVIAASILGSAYEITDSLSHSNDVEFYTGVMGAALSALGAVLLNSYGKERYGD